jgi:small-conductance mechanosensitive channel
MNFLETDFYGNSALAWLVAVGIAAGVTVILAIVRAVMTHWLKRRGADGNYLLVFIAHTRLVFLALVGVGLGAAAVTLPGNTLHVIGVIVSVAALLQIAWWGHGLLRFWLREVVTRRAESDVASVTAIRTLGTMGVCALWIVIALAIIGTLGVNVTGLVAGLGIGGIAIALAVQNIVGDLFASVSIIMDKPFVVGDFIQVDNLLGTVRKIGLKTTRIGSLSGEQLIFGNADLLKSRIHNYKRMAERRVVFTIGVEYGTARESVEKMPAMIRTAIEAQSLVRFDRAHLKEYGDSALVYEAVYYVLSPDYNQYMDIQQAINFMLYHDLEEHGIGTALRTRTVSLKLAGADIESIAEMIGKRSAA